MPEKPFVIFEEDFVKTMMDYEFYSKGIDVKDFGNSFLQRVLYSSSVTADGHETTITFQGDEKCQK